MNDLIDRQAAIDAIHEDADWLAVQGSDWQEERMERDKSILMSLPSAQPERCEDCGNFNKARLLIPQLERPERKKGKWMDKEDDGYHGGGYTECSVCGQRYAWGGYFEANEFRYCPRCGHRMEVEEDEI